MRRIDALDLTPGVQGASSRVTRLLPILGLRTCSSLMPSFSTPTGLELAELLRANGNFDVKLSRPTPDSQIGSSNSTSLRLRVSDANAWGADYFISIHTNASSIPSATGSEAFAFYAPSAAFSLGEDILEGLNEATGLRNRGMQVRTNLYVLRRTDMPAVLVELGFITNPRDAELMNTRPDLFAEGIYRGIVRYTL